MTIKEIFKKLCPRDFIVVDNVPEYTPPETLTKIADGKWIAAPHHRALPCNDDLIFRIVDLFYPHKKLIDTSMVYHYKPHIEEGDIIQYRLAYTYQITLSPYDSDMIDEICDYWDNY